MARPSTEVIGALRTAAARLREGADYQWGHAGSCNCGQLAQVVTGLERAAIYREVAGEWSEYLVDRCAVTGSRVDDVVATMVRFGFEPAELADLEQLSDPEVLAALCGGPRYLRHNDRDHVVEYLEAWAAMLERRVAA